MSKKRTYDIIIIGGGVSGISSAYHLLKSGFTGTIGLLEARNRLGGRIHTSNLSESKEMKIEIGANWIHGIIGNPVYDKLYKRQLVDPVKSDHNKSVSYNIQAKTLDGKDVNSYWVHKVYDAYSNMIKRSSLFFSSKNQDPPNLNSLGAFLKHEANKWIEAEIKNELEIEVVRGLFDSLLNRETCISGCDSMDEVNLVEFGAYEELAGGNLTIPSGYYSLIEALLEDISTMCNEKRTFEALKNCKVSTIYWPGIDQKGTKSSSAVTVNCANGEIFECAHLIVTLPLGVLKHEAQDLFKPALPQYKLDCIQQLGFGTVDKIFLEYSSKSAISNVFTRDGLTTDEMMLLWGSSEKDQWYSKIYSIYFVSNHCLQLWVSGKQANELENMSEEQINAELTDKLRRFFGDPKFPLADNVIVTRWGSDVFCRGSYSFISKCSSQDTVKRFAMPIYQNQHNSKPVIAFAGEATHENYFSTVHGAFLSGKIVSKHFVDTPN